MLKKTRIIIPFLYFRYIACIGRRSFSRLYNEKFNHTTPYSADENANVLQHDTTVITVATGR